MQYLKDDIKENIVKSALAEFKEKGYAGASMRVIANNAKMTSGNIYRYFKSKEDLFYYALGPVHEQVMDFGKKFQDEVSNSKVNYINFDSMDMIMEIYHEILVAFSEHRLELLILMDKSEGTKFEGTKEFIKLLINKILKDVFLAELEKQGKEVKDEFLLYVVASSLVDGIGDILRNCSDGERVKFLVESFISIVFHDISNRI
jgi:AcrR family transcriptional regulator